MIVMNDEIEVEVPKTVYVDVNLHLPKRLKKDLHDGQIICPHCHGTGIVKAQQITCIKKAKRKLCKDVENIKLYMIRFLQREYEKYRLSDNADALANSRCEISRANKVSINDTSK